LRLLSKATGSQSLRKEERDQRGTIRLTVSQMLVAYNLYLASWEAEIGRIVVQDQSGQIVNETLYPK
jgi:hypothetical protein